MEEKRYCALCKKEETRNECGYGPEAWDMATLSPKLFVKKEEMSPQELMLQKQQLRLNTMKLMQQRQNIQKKKSIESPMNPSNIEPVGVQKEGAERINVLGKYYTVSFTFRGLGKVIQFFVASTKRPTRDDIAKQLEKVYPGARLVHYYESFKQPQEPTIYMNMNEDHFKVGDEVICKDSGMEGEVVKLDKPSGKDNEEYYTVKREDGKRMKYAPNQLKLVKEEKDPKGPVQPYKSPEEIAKKHGVSIEEIQKQLKMGIKVEGEHTSDKTAAKITALQHLDEVPNYYSKLKKVEKKLKEGVSMEVDSAEHRTAQRAAKIRALVKRGATEGEKAAAQSKTKGPEWKRPTLEQVEEGMTMKDFKANRKKNERRAASADAEKRGHVGKEWHNTGRKYSADDAKSNRAKLSDDDRAARHRAAVDPDDDRDENTYSADRTKNPKKLRKQSAMGESAAWTRSAGKNKEGGLNEKGRKSYEAENPGSDLKAPSKKVGNPRRKSFCARMKGMKKKLTSSKTANDPDSRINKSLRAWNC